MINDSQLKKIMLLATTGNIAKFAKPINDACTMFAIDTSLRQAAFLAQVAHESGELRYVKELADGSAYEGRIDLGNLHPGDGPRYKGRGLLQITGRDNYYRLGRYLNIDLIEQPELLEQPGLAATSAAWFWTEKGLNDLADKGLFERITRRINGGLNHYQERLAYYQRAQRVLES
ncbi:glycoside hydrolase family 19 protein [Methylomonas koyamae]|uniref:glycoside hydrolase family 19 protein n=1 Tax=Methylomonas koyamae TaxID=702114 RepID=UPI001126EF15|nr:glycoside hydrolase family 19 protein [Methylomonas koyamae]TPQ24947.1 chitinase [Methylomonas koyamae]